MENAPVHIPFALGLSLEEWQSRAEAVSAFRKFLATTLGRDMVSVLYTQQPTGYPTRDREISDTHAAIELGRKEGYEDCLRIIRSMTAFPTTVPEHIESDFGYEELLKREGLLTEKPET